MTDDTDLALLRDRYPLPDSVQDHELSLADVAALFEKTQNTITDWHKMQGMPVKSHGGNGVAYVFQQSDVWAWYKHREAHRIESDRRKLSDRIKLQGLLFPDDEERDETAGMSDRDRKEFYEAQTLFHRTSEFRLGHVRREDVRETMESIFLLVRDGLQTAPDRLESECGATPQQVEMMARLMDDITVELNRSIQQSGLIPAQDPQTPRQVHGDQLVLN